MMITHAIQVELFQVIFRQPVGSFYILIWLLEQLASCNMYSVEFYA